MKLVIDIPEDLYKWIKDMYKNPNGEVAYSAIKNGIPYEAEGDLISREALKKHIAEIFEIEEKEDKKWAMGLKYSLKLIDNAPTVLHDNYSMGYQDGVRKVLSERPQGKWVIDQEGIATCPFCGERHCCKMHFCGNCGALMQGGAKE